MEQIPLHKIKIIRLFAFESGREYYARLKVAPIIDRIVAQTEENERLEDNGIVFLSGEYKILE